MGLDMNRKLTQVGNCNSKTTDHGRSKAFEMKREVKIGGQPKSAIIYHS